MDTKQRLRASWSKSCGPRDDVASWWPSSALLEPKEGRCTGQPARAVAIYLRAFPAVKPPPGLSPVALREHIRLKFSLAMAERENAALRAEAAKIASEMLRELVAATTRIFGIEEALIYESCDPEHPENKHVVLAVDTDLLPEQIVKAELDWVRETLTIAPNWDSVRLLIRPK